MSFNAFHSETGLDLTGGAGSIVLLYTNYACNDFARNYPVSTRFPQWETFLHYLPSRRPLRLFYRENVVISDNLGSTIWKLKGRIILVLIWL